MLDGMQKAKSEGTKKDSEYIRCYIAQLPMS